MKIAMKWQSGNLDLHRLSSLWQWAGDPSAESSICEILSKRVTSSPPSFPLPFFFLSAYVGSAYQSWGWQLREKANSATQANRTAVWNLILKQTNKKSLMQQLSSKPLTLYCETIHPFPCRSLVRRLTRLHYKCFLQFCEKSEVHGVMPWFLVLLTPSWPNKVFADAQIT